SVLWSEIERLGLHCTSGVARLRPLPDTVPVVLARVVDEYRRRIGLRRYILQVLIEERFEHIAAELERGVAVPFQRSQSRAIVVHTAMAPRAHDQEVPCISGVLRFRARIVVN